MQLEYVLVYTMSIIHTYDNIHFTRQESPVRKNNTTRFGVRTIPKRKEIALINHFSQLKYKKNSERGVGGGRLSRKT